MKYALIGCGRISTNHIRAAVNNHLEIVAVCDIMLEHMDTLLTKHDLQNDNSIKRYTNYKTMIQEVKPQLVSIATESGLHRRLLFFVLAKEQRDY